MRKLRYRRALNDALREEMQRDESVFAIGEDLRDPWGGTYKVTERLNVEFGDDRVLNTPISEGGIIGAALGAALAGMRPVAEIMYWDFAFLAADQIVNQAAKIRYMTGGQVTVPLVIRGANGGYKNSAAQHGQSLENFFAQVPGLLVAAPSTPADAKGLLKTAIRLDDPVIFVEHKSLYLDTGPVPDGEHLVPFGVADVKRAGNDVTIVAWGKMVPMSLRAAEALEADGIDAEVIDIRTLVPLDEEAILASVRRTGRMVVVTEGHRRGTFAAEIAAIVAERAHEHLRAPVHRVAALDVPLPMAPNLEPLILPQVEWIVTAARSAMTRSGREPVITGDAG